MWYKIAHKIIAAQNSDNLNSDFFIYKLGQKLGYNVYDMFIVGKSLIAWIQRLGLILKPFEENVW